MESYSHPSYPYQPPSSFSGYSFPQRCSEGSRIFSQDSSSSPNGHTGSQPPMSDAEVSGPGVCQFRRLVVDDCSRSRLFAMALEHFLLRRDPYDSSPVRCIICHENYSNARAMLRHLRDCEQFHKGEYCCPTCNIKESFRTSSRRKCSWLRTRLGNKIKKGLEDALKLLPGSKQTLCSNCRKNIEAVEQSSSHSEKASGASLGGKGLATYSFPTSSASTGQQYNKPQPAQTYPVPRYSELGDTPLRELLDTSPPSELSNMNLAPVDEYPCLVNGLETFGSSFPRDIPEMDGGTVGSRAFAKLADEQIFPTSSSPPYAPVETSPFASYNKSPTEVSSAAPTRTSPVSVSPTWSTNSSGRVSSCHAHLSQGKSFSNKPGGFGAESSNGYIGSGFGHSVGPGSMPPAFMPALFQGPSWNTAGANMRSSSPLSIDTGFVNANLSSSFTWGPGQSYDVTPTMASFRTSLSRSATNSAPKHNTSENENENESPKSAHSSSSTLSSSSSSSSSSTTMTEASLTSDSPVSASTDEARGAGHHRCPDCDFRPTGNVANFNAYLRKHRMKHSLRHRIKCSDCDATFTRRDNWQSHVRTVHGGRKRAGSSGISPLGLKRKKTQGPETGGS